METDGTKLFRQEKENLGYVFHWEGKGARGKAILLGWVDKKLYVVVLSLLMGFCRQVVWLSDVDRAKGYAVDFLSLSLHAISRDPEAYPSPCLYTQVYTFSHLQCTEFFNGHVMFLSQIYLSLKCFLVKKLGLKIILLSFWVFRISFVAAL